MRVGRSGLVSAVVIQYLALAGWPAYGDTVRAVRPLVEKIDVTVVNVDVTVTDNGQPVRGLTAADFELLEDGKPQKITNFHEVDTSARGQSAPAAAASERFRRKILLLVDNVNTSRHAHHVALQALQSFLEESFQSEDEWFVATVDGRVNLLLNGSRSKDQTQSVIRSMQKRGPRASFDNDRDPFESEKRGRPVADFQRISDLEPNQMGRNRGGELAGVRSCPVGQFLEFPITREETLSRRNSVVLIAEAARAFGAIEGKKIILLVTGGMPLLTQENPAEACEPPQFVSQANRAAALLQERLIKEANASNTSLYIIGAEGHEVNPEGYKDNVGLSSMYWIARETGGKYLGGNSIDRSLHEVDRLSGSFYSLGYRPDHDVDQQYRKLKVRLKGKRYHVQVRRGYSRLSNEQQLLRALSSTTGVTMQKATLPIVAQTLSPIKSPKGSTVPVEISVPMDGIHYVSHEGATRGRVHLYVSVFDTGGHNVALRKFIQDVELGADETTAGKRVVINIPGLTFKAGAYRMVVAVRDDVTDAIGLSMVNIVN